LFSVFLFQSVRSFVGHAVTLPPDGNNVTGRPVARGIEHARRGGCLDSEGTAEHYSSPDDSARHGNVRHIRSTLAITGAIVGVGAARKTAAVRWNVASDVILAWIVTLPAAALFGAAFYQLYKLLS
jgi:hypothetical protein